MSKSVAAKREMIDPETHYQIDFTPYYLLNGFLPIFWFAYQSIGVIATYLVISALLTPENADEIWAPVIYFTLGTAFLALTISCTVMGRLLVKYEPHRAVQILKIPAFVAMIFFGLSFLIPILNFIQTLFTSY